MLLVPDPRSVSPLLTGDGGSRRDGRAGFALYLAWLVTALWLASRHVLWRDEVRGLTLALAGDGVPAMLRAIHGEGHPALWYLLLRAGHAVVGPAALPGLGFVIGAAAAALFAWRAPFRPLVIGAMLFGAFALHEYTVLARNYGMAMLLLFAFASVYPRWRERGIGLGLLLALLANTNVPAVMLAGALGLFWGVEILCADGWRWSPAWRRWIGNMVIALVGVALCFAAVYPPANDAAVSPLAGRLSVGTVLTAALNLAAPFGELWPPTLSGAPLAPLLLAALVVGAPLGVLRAPGGLAAGLMVMLAMPLFFQLVYPGGYRHQALYPCFLLTLYWLVAQGGGGRWPGAPPFRPAVARWGQAAMLALLLLQVATSIGLLASTARGEVNGRARDLADLLRREALGDAVLVADADVMLEAVPYYARNPIWLIRSRRWGEAVPFTKANTYDLRLGDVLATARALGARTGRPVVIVTQLRLDPIAPRQTWEQGYIGTFTTTPGEVRAFLSATRRLARFAPARTDESYDVYLLTAVGRTIP